MWFRNALYPDARQIQSGDESRAVIAELEQRQGDWKARAEVMRT